MFKQLITGIFIFLVTCQLCFADDMEEIQKREWQLVRHKDGIKVYMKHRDESKIKSFKATMTMDVPDPYAMVAVFDNYEVLSDWIHFVSEVSDLGRKSETDRLIRIETRLPWPVANRDTAARATISQDPINHDIRIEVIAQDGIIDEVPGYIRMPELIGTVDTVVLPNRKLHITLEFLLDPGGYVPTWMTNIILKDVPYFSLKKLRKIILRPEFQNMGHEYPWITVPQEYYDGTYQRVQNSVNVPAE